MASFPCSGRPSQESLLSRIPAGPRRKILRNSPWWTTARLQLTVLRSSTTSSMTKVAFALDTLRTMEATVRQRGVGTQLQGPPSLHWVRPSPARASQPSSLLFAPHLASTGARVRLIRLFFSRAGLTRRLLPRADDDIAPPAKGRRKQVCKHKCQQPRCSTRYDRTCVSPGTRQERSI